jgi:1-deoxy-D-xylulose-5-phosphate synthase
MLNTAVRYQDGPVALRYPRGSGPGTPVKPGFDLLPIGKAETLRKGADVAILAVGAMVQNSLKAADILAAEGITCEVVNARFVKPLDDGMLRALAGRFTRLVTVEDNSVMGGFGSGVAEFLTAEGITGLRLRIHGLPDRFVEHGSPEELYRDLGLDPPGIAQVVRGWVAERTVSPAAPVGLSLS